MDILLVKQMDTVSSCVPRTEGELDKINEMLPDFDASRIFNADYDGTSEKGSCMKAATYFSDVAIGATSVEMLMDHIKNGTEMPMSTAVPAEVMTPDNYKDFQ